MEHYFTNNTELKSELRIIDYKYQNYSFHFNSDNGVFAKNKIDYGSKLLVETIIKNTNRQSLKILDVGSGYGFMGIVLAKVLNSEVTLIDVNKRAVHLTNMNIKENKVLAKSFISDIYENISNKYDFIITNPPIRAGKKVVLKILLEASDYLVDEGILWFVMRKDQGLKSTLKELDIKYNYEIIEKSKGFYIIKCKKKLT